jgi:hypothetical protein
MTVVASGASDCDTPLRAVFKINLNGKTVSIGTVGQAYRFITNLSSIEWIEFRSLHADAVSSLHGRRRECDADRAGRPTRCVRCSSAPSCCNRERACHTLSGPAWPRPSRCEHVSQPSEACPKETSACPEATARLKTIA